MSYRNLFSLVLVLMLCLLLAACGGGEGADTDSITDPDSVADTSESNVGDDTVSDDPSVTETEPAEEKSSILIGDLDISEFGIADASDDATAKTIADYFHEKVNTIAGFDIPTIYEYDESSVSHAVVIGTKADLEKDEFVIEVKDGKLYISYAEGASAYQAVTSVLDDTLFSNDSAYTLASDFSFSGICGDYIIGDNEFNPFE